MKRQRRDRAMTELSDHLRKRDPRVVFEAADYKPLWIALHKQNLTNRQPVAIKFSTAVSRPELHLPVTK